MIVAFFLISTGTTYILNMRQITDWQALTLFLLVPHHISLISDLKKKVFQVIQEIFKIKFWAAMHLVLSFIVTFMVQTALMQQMVWK